MRLNKILKNALLIISAGIILTACATKKEVAVEAPKKEETINLILPYHALLQWL